MLRLEQEGMANHRCELSKLVIWAGLETSVRCQSMLIVKPAPTITLVPRLCLGMPLLRLRLL
ncbi:MAG: hypothetical protein RIM23_02995 [Coleofasciculus sp. G3-WIS-01]|uniref:hypothetical protein n=1 Tax=Coleofasciculus sp. G3-WIS-01 TaxID=3069528 RepID=UPI0032F74092